MNTFKRYSTTAYNSQNLSITSVIALSEPERYVPEPEDYSTIFAKLLVLGPDSDANDTTMTEAFIFQTGWYLRLLQDEYRDDIYSALSYLRSFFMVPIQFTVTAWQFANATLTAEDPGLSLYALPPDLEAIASPGRSIYRTVARYPATVYVFMTIVGVLFSGWVSLFLIVVLKPVWFPRTSHFFEVDACSKAGYPPSRVERPVLDYSSALRASGLANAKSGTIVRAAQGMVIRAVEIDGSAPGNEFMLLAAAGDSDTLAHFNGLSAGTLY